MIQNLISAGPPLQGPSSWNSSKPERLDESKESFESTLKNTSARESRPLNSSVDQKRAEAPQRSTDKNDKVDRSEKSEKSNKAVETSSRKVERQDDKKEAASEKADNSVKKENPLEKKATVLRQKAIEQFMDSFESEFEIPPTRLVEAMAQLPAEDLTLNPEQTADSVLAQLDLTEEQEARAKEMYLTLVSDLNRIDKAAVPPVMVTAQQDLMMQPQIKGRFAEAQEKKSLLNQSLDRMNGQFWMKSAAPQAPAATVPNQGMESTAGMDPWARQELASEFGFDQEADFTAMNPSGEFPVMEQPQGEMPVQGPKDPNAAQTQGKSKLPADLMEQLKRLSQEQEQSLSSRPELSASMEGARATQMQATGNEALKGSKFNDALPMQAQGQGGPVIGTNLKNSSFQGEGALGQGSGKEDGGKSAGGSKETLKASGLDGFKMPEMMTQASTNKEVAANPAPFVAPTTAARPGEVNEDANIRQLLNQAQYLIKKGGGEVRVEMNPEGLGHLQMKMVINEGKVNLEMAAESKEAKQVIESGLNELKSSLAAHKLSVDHIKVDVVNNASTDNSTQNQFNSNAQKEGTRQFWNQFQESFGNRSQREAMFGAQDLKGYGGRRRDPLQPVETSTTERRRSADGRGEGLNLVA